MAARRKCTCGRAEDRNRTRDKRGPTLAILPIVPTEEEQELITEMYDLLQRTLTGREVLLCLRPRGSC